MAAIAINRASQRGQAIIELSLSMALAVLLFSGLLIVAYLSFAKLWTSYQIEQAMLCSMSLEKSQSICVRQLNNKVQQTLPWGQFDARITKSEPSNSTELLAHLRFFKERHFRWKKSLNLESAATKAFSPWPCSAGARCSWRSSRVWP